MNRLPPLKSLEAFAIAGRLESFSKAALELNLSLSALSRRIKSLEDDLGLRLFERRDKSVVLTEVGREYLQHIAPAFDDMRAATRDLRTPEDPRLRISLLQSFAQNWLLPRLDDFHARHPEIRIEFETTVAFTDFARAGVDLAIRLCRPHWPGLDVDILFYPEIFPVCAPPVLEALGSTPRPELLAEMLADHALLHSVHLPDAFMQWFEAAGAPLGHREQDQYFDNMNILYQTAAAGRGVGLGLDALVNPFLNDGRLVAAHELRVRPPHCYCLIGRPSERRRPAVAAFRRWLIETIRQT